MTRRSDITVDLAAPPRTILDYATHALYGLLVSYPPGTAVPVQDVDAAILAATGPNGLAYKATATKALRNQGILVNVTKRRHLSVYAIDPLAVEVTEVQERRREEAYSEWVTRCRSLAGKLAAMPTPDPMLVAEHGATESHCIQLGRLTGRSLAVIAADLVPL